MLGPLFQPISLTISQQFFPYFQLQKNNRLLTCHPYCTKRTSDTTRHSEAGITTFNRQLIDTDKYGRHVEGKRRSRRQAGEGGIKTTLLRRGDLSLFGQLTKYFLKLQLSNYNQYVIWFFSEVLELAPNGGFFTNPGFGTRY